MLLINIYLLFSYFLLNTIYQYGIQFNLSDKASLIVYFLLIFQETNPPNDFGLEAVTTEGKRDFSNPMYDAYGQLESQATADAVNYSIPSGGSSAGSSSASGSRGSPASTLAAGASGFMEAPSAVISPSSVIHQSSPQIRHKELAPSTVDTGKDTQCLVVDEDDSEC